MSQSVTQIDAHCSSCKQNAKVSPAHVGRRHKKHIHPQSWKRNGGKWIAGLAPDEKKDESLGVVTKPA